MATFTEFLSVLNSSKQQAIFWHNQTNSYAEHKALNHYYDGILDLLDGLVESTAGIYGRPQDYTTLEPTNYQSLEETIAYFKELYDYVQTERGSLYTESWIQNQIDEVSQLIAQTLYELTLR
jgi:hypothetical protein